MEKPKKSSLFKRVATALVLAPLTIALIYAGSPWINVLALVFGAMLSWEWAHMVPNRNAPFYATAYTTSLSAAGLLNCPGAVARFWQPSRRLSPVRHCWSGSRPAAKNAVIC